MILRRCILSDTARAVLGMREGGRREEERERRKEAKREERGESVCVDREEEATTRGSVVCGADKYSAKSAKLFTTEQRSCWLSALGFGFMEKYE